MVPHLEISGAAIGAASLEGIELRFTAPARPPRPRRMLRRSKELSALHETLYFSELLREHFFEKSGQEEMIGEVVVKEEVNVLVVVWGARGASVAKEAMTCV